MAKHFIEAMKNARVQMLIPARTVDKKELPEVLLPRFHYYPDELNRRGFQLHGQFVPGGTEGATPFIMRQVAELDDDQFEACMADPNFVGMLKKGSYLIIDALPARFHNQGENDRQLLAKYRDALVKAGLPVPTLDDDALLEELTRPDGAKAS